MFIEMSYALRQSYTARERNNRRSIEMAQAPFKNATFEMTFWPRIVDCGILSSPRSVQASLQSSSVIGPVFLVIVVIVVIVVIGLIAVARKAERVRKGGGSSWFAGSSCAGGSSCSSSSSCGSSCGGGGCGGGCGG